MANKQCIEEKIDALNQLANASQKQTLFLSAFISTQAEELKNVCRDSAGYQKLKEHLNTIEGRQAATKQCLEEKIDALNQLANASQKQTSSLSALISTQSEELKSICRDSAGYQKLKDHLCAIDERQKENNQCMEEKIDALNQLTNASLRQSLSLSACIASQAETMKSIILDIEKFKLESVKEETLCTLRKDIQNDILKLREHFDKLLTQQNEFQEHAKLIEQYSKLILVNNILGQADRILKQK